MNIEILLATYNSSKYLREQLDSIFNQDFKDWTLTIRDDCSKDNTIEIINEYILKYPNKVKLLNTDKNLGAKENFNTLLASSTAAYVMFADHDDVWLPNKISLTYNRMLEVESKFGKFAPVLVFTDKSIVDEHLKLQYNSHTEIERYDTKDMRLNRLLVQNVASGCSMMVNRPLIDICGKIPKDAIMHDYWLMLVAVAFGEISYVDEPTMLYRQHSSNELGAVVYGWKYIMNKVMKGRANVRKRFDANIMQGAKFLEHYKDKLPMDKLKILKEFSKLESAEGLTFRYILIKNNFLKTGFVRKIGMLM